MSRWLTDFLEASDDANARLRLLTDVWALSRSVDDLQDFTRAIFDRMNPEELGAFKFQADGLREEFRRTKDLLERVEGQMEKLGAEVRKP